MNREGGQGLLQVQTLADAMYRCNMECAVCEIVERKHKNAHDHALEDDAGDGVTEQGLLRVRTLADAMQRMWLLSENSVRAANNTIT